MSTSGISQVCGRILFAIIICIMSFPAYAKYSGGTGEPNDPYQIATAQDLIDLGNEPNDYDKHFIMIKDIDLASYIFDRAVIAPDTNDANWDFDGTPFVGVFDGNDHTISNLTIQSYSFLGLFGQTDSGAIISNLGMEAVDVIGTGDYVGGLVGFNGGSITNCYSTGSVSGTEWCVGGLMGENWGNITQCYSNGTVSSTSDYLEGDGGLVGVNWGTVTQCYSIGIFSGDDSVGGLVGGNSGTLTECYSNGIVSSNYNVGGLVGWNDGTLTECYSNGMVSGNYSVGGLVGYNLWWGTATQCFWDTQTSGQTESAAGTGKTTTEMQTKITFTDAGWDFVGEIDNGTEYIWWIDEGQDYPKLWWDCNMARLPVIEIDAPDFFDVIADGVVLMDFYATWCSHCATQAPILEEVADQIKSLAQVAKFDVDKSSRIVDEFDINAIPTLILFKNGIEITRFVGVTQADDLVAAIMLALD